MDPATTEIYTLSLHDALPISRARAAAAGAHRRRGGAADAALRARARSAGGRGDRRGVRAGDLVRRRGDRKSTRLNSSHGYISYAVFCLKKKKTMSLDPFSIII